MKIKYLIIFLPLILFMAGCTGKPKTMFDELVVYCLADDAMSRYYVYSFMLEYPDVPVVRKTFRDVAEMDELIINELNVGEGPDVIIFTDETGLDVVRMAKNGAFASLDKRLNEDESFNRENYLTAALSAGEVNGRQYILPLTFMIPIVFYDAEGFSTFTPAPIISYHDFMESVKTNVERFKFDENYSILLMQRVTTPLIFSSQVLPTTAKNRRENFNEQGLKDIVDFLYLYYNECHDKSRQITATRGWGVEVIIENMMYFYTYSPGIELMDYYLRFFEGFYQRRGVENLGISAFSEIGSDNVTAILERYGVITNNAHPLAYEFLRMAMDTNQPTSIYRDRGLSTNKEMIEFHLDKLINANPRFFRRAEGGFWIEPISEKLAQNIRQIYNGIDNVVIPNPKVIDIFRDVFTPYFENNKTYNECANEFIQRLNLYLTE